MDAKEAEDTAKEILGKTTYKDIPAKNQFALLKLLLENLGNHVGNKDIAAKLKESGVLPMEMDSDVARRQVLKTVNIIEKKLQQYALSRDSKPQYCYIVEKGQGGSAVRLVSASEVTADYSIQQFTARIPYGLVRLVKHYSASTGKPIDEIVREALEMWILSKKNYLGEMKERKTHYPLNYRGIGGGYLDDLRRPSTKKK